MKALIAQFKGCLLNCFDWVLGIKLIARGIDACFLGDVSLCASKITSRFLTVILMLSNLFK